METLFTFAMYGIVGIGILLGGFILIKLAFKVIVFVISLIAVVVVIAGLLMVFNYSTCGTPFPNGKSFSDEFKILNERNNHKASKVSPKASKAVSKNDLNDLSVKEIETPHQIEGVKEVEK